ncbi:MAG: hypothetical protein JXA69_07225 [Phycisphaerae bacterium]|nr:hypothetical protein [Phycisphaerae bacterium]
MYEALRAFNLYDALSWISSQDPGIGMVLVGAGLTFFLCGWRLPRFLLGLSLSIVGLFLAVLLAQGVLDGVVLAVCGTALCVFLAVRVTRVAMAIMAGGWGGLLAIWLLTRVNADPGLTLIAGGVVAAIVAAVSLSSFRPGVAFVTSVEGTILILIGSLIVLSSHASMWPYIREAIGKNPVFLPFCLLAGTISGYYLQIAEVQEKESGLAGT